jgi:FSR family fosmidomycin resistance protein-like MFS transporter
VTLAALDRRGLGVLALGHLSADLCQGAVPAMLPFLASERGYSYTALGALLLAATVASSVLQPLFGLVVDRVERAWLMPGGLLLAGAGIAVAGVVPGYAATFAAIAMSGLGVAAFHPEGARFASLASGLRRGRGMSLFSVGGNAGVALGPVIATLLIVAFGLPGTLGLVVLPALAAALLAREVPRLRARRAPSGAGARAAAAVARAGRAAWGPFARLGGAVALRSSVYFGLQAFVPAYFVAVLGTSEAAGNTALTVMFFAGAIGTLVGGALADRLAPRTVLVASLVGLVPLLVALPLSGQGAASLLLAAIGFCMIASFSVTIVLGHEYLPGRLGLASGVTLGLSIGVGGLVAVPLGVLADRLGPEAALWVVAALPLPAIALALSLPRPESPAARDRTPAAQLASTAG